MTEALRHHRVGRLKLAVGTGLASKLPALLLQLLAMPLMLAGLGTDAYAAFFTLTALLGWVSLMGLGLLPSVAREVAHALGAGDRPLAHRMAREATLLFALLGALLAAGSVFLAGTVDLVRAVGISASISPEQLRVAWIAVCAVTALALAGSVAPALRAGWQELHVANSLNAVSSLLALAAVALVSWLNPVLWLYVLALFLPLAAVQMADLVRMLWKGRMSGQLAGRRAACARLSGPAVAVLLVQGAAFITIHGSVILVSRVLGPEATAQFSSVMRPLLIASGIFGALIAPSVPALANAIAHGDYGWARNLVLKAYGFVGGLSALAAVVLLLFGPELLRLWLRQDLGIDHLLTGFAGGYFLLWMLQFLGFNLLLGIGRLQWLAMLFLAEALAAMALGLWLMPVMGPAGMATGLLIAALLGTGWALPLLIWRAVRGQPEMAADQSGQPR